jgi:hypothetical protein
MRDLYKFCALLVLFAGFYLHGLEVAAQCPADRAVSPAAVTICAGSTVSVVVTNAETNMGYQLQDAATNAALSGFYIGANANLTLTSSAISANVTI